MTLLQAVFLGLVQGITEFLPISSSGHLSLLSILFQFDTSTGLLFDVMLHVGTLTAICLAFRKDIKRLFIELIRMIQDICFNISTSYNNHKNLDARRYRRMANSNYRRFLEMILMSTIPTALIGYMDRELVSLASENLLVVGICFLLTAVLLLIADMGENGRKVPNDISFSNAFMIGIAQGISTLPGLSRSGITIAACLMSGFDKGFAVRYSFIMSIPAILGAAILEIGEVLQSPITLQQFGIYFVGSVVAGVVGYFAIRKMIGIVKRKSLKGFAAYCLVIGIISLTGYITHE